MNKYFFLSLFILGALVSFWFLKLVFYSFYVKKVFTQTKAKILNYQISENFMQNSNVPISNPRKYYELYLQYEYSIDGKKFQSNQLNIFNKIHADKAETLEQFIPPTNENGERILTIFVNPKNPNEVFALPTSWNKWTYSMISFLLVSFTLFCGFLILVN